MEKGRVEVELPGFRFHPTEEELLDFYLKRMLLRNNNTPFHIIPFLNIYLYDPWFLPGLSKIGEREWYFFVPRDRKHGSGGRPNRTTQYGFWKATGSDRKIFSLSDPKKHLGLKKTLVFYKGRAPKGTKTDWIMNEYRLPDSTPFPKDIVLCKIYRKATSMKVLEQRAVIEEEEEEVHSLISSTPPQSPMETISFSSQIVDFSPPPQPMESCHVSVEVNQDFPQMLEDKLKNEPEEIDDANNMNHVSKVELHEKTESVDNNNDDNNDNNKNKINNVSKLNLPMGMGTEKLWDLQLPKTSVDWTQDAFWTQHLRSPWLDNLIFTPPYYANILNF